MEGLVSIAKFAFAVLVLPVIFAITSSFNHTIDKYSFFSFEFRAGIAAYVIVHLFIFPFKIVHAFGQKIVELMFKFSSVLSKTVPLFVPFFTIVLLVSFGLAKENDWPGEQYWAFFVGMALAMHLLMTAQILREEDSNAVKPHYFFLMSWVYVLNLSLVVVLLSFLSQSISLKDFFVTAMIKAKDIYLVLLKHLL